MRPALTVATALVGCVVVGLILASGATGIADAGAMRPPALLCEAYDGRPRAADPHGGAVFVPAGTFQMGSDRFYPEERPVHRATIDGFWIDRHPVTNGQFAAFVTATGYVTRAERGLDAGSVPGLSDAARVPGSLVFSHPKDGQAGHWRFSPGANWRQPEGPGSSIGGRANHPVVQVTVQDAEAYARWAGRVLPTEAQFERAARGGLDDADYSWGREMTPGDRQMANSWQGPFPLANRTLDGFEGTSPVGCFPANEFGLFDMGGNVWELTADWYRPGHEPVPGANPTGPATSRDPRQPNVPARVIKGGSHLCSPELCWRFRPSARQPQETFLATSHVGFRTVAGPHAR